MRTMKKFSRSLLKVLVIVVVGGLITELSKYLPINGIEIVSIRCGLPGGLPFAYRGVWRGGMHIMCVTDFHLTIYLLDILIWSIILAILDKVRHSRSN
jgi:hypothetical protein